MLLKKNIALPDDSSLSTALSLEAQLKNELSCPITYEYFKTPILMCDHHYYEQSAIVKWINNNKTSPMTGLDMTIDQVWVDIRLNKIIKKCKEHQFQFENTTLLFSILKILEKDINTVKLRNIKDITIQLLRYKLSIETMPNEIVDIQEVKKEIIRTLNELSKRHKENKTSRKSKNFQTLIKDSTASIKNYLVTVLQLKKIPKKTLNDFTIQIVMNRGHGIDKILMKMIQLNLENNN